MIIKPQKAFQKEGKKMKILVQITKNSASTKQFFTFVSINVANFKKKFQYQIQNFKKSL